MRILSKSTLKTFWDNHPDSQAQLEAWYEEVVKADWATPQELKAQFGHASILKNNRVVFNIKGNNYRLVVKINYPYHVIYVRFIGTHSQYDEIDVETI
jgi:mRNA interferase HigB